jgi:hypothetical protein
LDKQGRLRAGYRHLDSMVPVRPSGQVQPPTRVLSLRPRPQRTKQIIIPPLRTDLIGARYKGRLSHFIDMPETCCSGWKPPRSWPKDFPRHPMHIPDDAPKCGICTSWGDCKCIQVIRDQPEPLVVDDGPRGEGLWRWPGWQAPRMSSLVRGRCTVDGMLWESFLVILKPRAATRWQPHQDKP